MPIVTASRFLTRPAARSPSVYAPPWIVETHAPAFNGSGGRSRSPHLPFNCAQLDWSRSPRHYRPLGDAAVK